MKKTVSETREVKTTQRYCDECSVLLKHELACTVAQCEVCGKDLCEKCIGHEEPSSGDYRDVYCAPCWEVGKKYRDAIKEAEDKIEKLDEEWRAVCRREQQ